MPNQNPVTGVFESVPLESRIWEHIQKTDTCWLWTGAKDVQGYGQTSIVVDGKQRLVKAHRAVYEVVTGESIAGLDLHHICEQKSCCNPAHLVPLTRSAHLQQPHENVRARRVSVCKHGHEMSGDNIYVWRGLRACRACNLRHTRKRRGVSLNPVRFPQTCWKCGNSWTARVEHPKFCPNQECKVRQYGPSRGKPCPAKVTA